MLRRVVPLRKRHGLTERGEHSRKRAAPANESSVARSGEVSPCSEGRRAARLRTPVTVAYGRRPTPECTMPFASFKRPAVSVLAAGSGPWRTMPNAGALRPTFVPPNGVSACYQASISKRARSTYYRFVSPATIAYATPPSSITRGPASTSIKGFAVNPRWVRAGQRIKVSG